MAAMSNDLIKDLQDLFDMAWDINNSGNGTDLSRKVTTVLPGVLQDLQAIDPERIVVLPCRVGDTVYKIDTDPLLDSREILELTIDNFVVCEDGEILVKYDSWDGVICTADNLVNGTAYLDYYRVFLTREEAEAALRKEGAK